MIPFPRLRLFLGLVWRQWEPPACGIPDPYRVRHRIAWREAAVMAHLRQAKEAKR